MKFRPSKTIIVCRKLTIKDPDGVSEEVSEAFVDMKVFRQSEIDTFFENLRKMPERGDETDEAWARVLSDKLKAVNQPNVELLKAMIVGWPDDSGIEDEDGKPLPFSPAALANLLDHPWAVVAGMDAYHRSIGSVRAGN